MSYQVPDYYHAAVVPETLRRHLCGLCRTPLQGELCRLCHQCRQAPGTARPDLAGFTVYAVRGAQSGTDMHRYKGQPPGAQALSSVRLLLAHGLEHLDCASQLIGARIEAVAVVPSRSRFTPGTPSPLQQLCGQLLPPGLPLVDLRPAPGSTSDRQVRPEAFDVSGCQDLSHVLLIDDTWVSGATVMSAAGALRSGGAEHVSALVLARWLDPGYGPTGLLVKKIGWDGGWVSPRHACPFALDGACPATTPWAVSRPAPGATG